MLERNPAKRREGIPAWLDAIVARALAHKREDRFESALVMKEGLEIPLVFEKGMVAYNKARVGGPVQAPIGACRSNFEGIFIKK